ncbi:MAG: hydantoinase/oxoprolinase family protein [Thaumarchaeota archaeon]|nr:hydantoinase/oxoprolinase family protein [Nitrososphaerota archaeon]MDG6907684.1 hydantoinase/oxoprolinase family protein [Nitrososphaerota archaeon]
MTFYRLGFDIGGTFTDLIAIDESSGKATVVKCPTTPKDPSLGVVNGLESLLSQLKISGNDLSLAVHSTTLVTNTVIEKSGAVTALLTTKGFKDVLEIGREKRITVYDIFEEKLPPLVPRYLRVEVDERSLYNGRIEKKVEKNEIVRIARRLSKLHVESVAVSFIHSYANPEHEKKVKQTLSKELPELGVSISSEVLPEWREYERTSTTVINAYAQPKTRKYMHVIESTLGERGFGGRLFIMQSSGGLSTVDSASRFPVKIIESGPAAGALAAAYLGKLTGASNMLSFDMGGTTAKCCLIVGGEPRVTMDFEVAGYMYLKGSGYPVMIPTVDLLEIGAGGGSIAHIDYGLLKVGPKSAGADPGPACYPKGGEDPTVTDADLILGYLNPEYFLGGEISLNKEKSQKILEEKIASKLGVSIEQAASGICDVVNSNMARAMRIVSVERGQDPASLTMIAFGGAGPVHSTRLARQLKIHRVVVPLAAGVTSALGLLVADMKFDLVRTYMSKVDSIDKNRVSELYEDMKEEADTLLSKTEYDRKYVRSVDMRYSGQAFELSVPFGSGFEEYDFEALKNMFLQLYQNRYGYTTNDPIECVNWRLVALGIVPKVSLAQETREETMDIQNALKGRRRAYFAEAGGYVDCNVYDRYKLFDGAMFEGPAIVEEKESTCVVLPEQKVRVDRYANLIVED